MDCADWRDGGARDRDARPGDRGDPDRERRDPRGIHHRHRGHVGPGHGPARGPHPVVADHTNGQACASLSDDVTGLAAAAATVRPTGSGAGEGVVGVADGVVGDKLAAGLPDVVGVSAPRRCRRDAVPDAVGVAAGDAAPPNVASVATPFASIVRLIGFVTPRLAQPRLVKEPLSLAARNVKRLLPTAGSAAGRGGEHRSDPAASWRSGRHHVFAVGRRVPGRARARPAALAGRNRHGTGWSSRR